MQTPSAEPIKKGICGDAFNGCTSLKDIITAEDMDEIYDECFGGCGLLKETLEKKARLCEKLREGNAARSS